LSKVGSYASSLSKGASSTTWIWNLHASAHDLDIHTPSSYESKVLSSHASHLSFVLFWISGMHYHGAYYSNYHVWLKDSSLVTPSSHLVWSLVGQESLNASTLSSSITPSCDSFYTGIPITAGFFHLWRSAGICSVQHLQYGCMASLRKHHLCTCSGIPL
jgi:photosystem I P700 chlorophyll a apoprotein A1